MRFHIVPLPMEPTVTHILTLGSIFVKLCECSKPTREDGRIRDACEKTLDYRSEFDQT